MYPKNGKFIVLYGINNLGKTTQAKMLVNRLNRVGQKAEYLKYPIYDLGPSGGILNNYLRGGNKYGLTARETQIIYSLNRTQFQETLLKKLNNGVYVIAEDYIGTGMAWGLGDGVNENFLKHINFHLRREDLAFLLDGERFTEAIEEEHKHETDENLTKKVREIHLKLAQEYGWIKINANLTIEEIHQQLWKKIMEVIKEPASHYSAAKPPAANGQPQIATRNLSPATKFNTGLNLYSTDYYSLLPGERVAVQTGIKLVIPNGYAGLILGEDKITKDGVYLTAKLIDPGFQDEITVNLINFSNDIYHVSLGQKVARLLIEKVESLKIVK